MQQIFLTSMMNTEMNLGEYPMHVLTEKLFVSLNSLDSLGISSSPQNLALQLRLYKSLLLRNSLIIGQQICCLSTSVICNCNHIICKTVDYLCCYGLFFSSCSAMPQLMVKNMSINQSIDVPMTTSDTVTCSGNLHTQNGNGSGNFTVAFRRVLSHQSWGEVSNIGNLLKQGDDHTWKKCEIQEGNICNFERKCTIQMYISVFFLLKKSEISKIIYIFDHNPGKFCIFSNLGDDMR